MTARRPSNRPAAQARRDRIVESARELLREREAAKVIVSDVAARADVSAATVYNLVGTRDVLMVAVLDAAVADVETQASPFEPARPIDSLLEIIERSVDVLTADPIALRRAILAIGEPNAGLWMDTTVGALLEHRMRDAADLVDGSIRPERLAWLMQVGFRGVVISWCYGHIADADFAPTANEIVLHVLTTTARSEIALEAKQRLVDIAATTNRYQP